jgi:serralysin
MPSPFTSSDTSTYVLSGVGTIDALLSNDKQKWSNLSLTYSFPWYGGADAYWQSDYSVKQEQAAAHLGLNDIQIAAVSAALQTWADVANITFAQVPDNANVVGDFRFAFSSAVTDFWGWSSYPSSYAASSADVWITTNAANEIDWSPKSFNFNALLHEIGHGLGLKHPGNYDNSTDLSIIYIPAALDFRNYTVMSYNAWHPWFLEPGKLQYTNVLPATPMVYDIAAIQYLYGANNSYQAGDNTYTFDPAVRFYMAIWDAGGTDTIDISNFSTDCTIDLRAGNYSSIYYTTTGTIADLYDGSFNLGIAFGVTIEMARGGTGNDTITGNNASNTLYGETGDDTIAGGAGSDLIFGGNGTDTDVFSGNFADYIISFDAATLMYTVLDKIQERDGTDVMSFVENFQFSDVKKISSTLPVNGTGIVQTDYLCYFVQFLNNGFCVATQVDGKSLVAGTNAGDFLLLRYNGDGSSDTSFDFDGKVTTDFSSNADFGYNIVVQLDGKIIVAGTTGSDFALARYNSDGSLDITFDNDGKILTDFGSNTDSAYAVTLQADGKILAGGTNGNEFVLSRYNSDGSLDVSFSGDGKVTTDVGGRDDTVRSVTAQADGKILVTGTSTHETGNEIDIIRYYSDGSIDTGFFDTTAPTLTTLSFPAIINLANNSASVCFSAEAEDNIGGSGVDKVVVYLDNEVVFDAGPGSSITIGGFSDTSTDTFTDSTPTTANSINTFLSSTNAGVYHVTQVLVYDVAGNIRTYNETEVRLLGCPANFTVEAPVTVQFDQRVVLADGKVFVEMTIGKNFLASYPFILEFTFLSSTLAFEGMSFSGGYNYHYSGTSDGTTVTVSLSGTVEQPSSTFATMIFKGLTGTGSFDMNVSKFQIAGADVIFTDPVAFDFDMKPPTVLMFSPADSATEVAASRDIVLTFNEAIQKGTGTIAIHSGSATGPVVESYDTATSANLTISDNTLTINPTSDLSNGTHYFITLDAGSVKDISGNNYAGTDTYDFTTAAASSVHDLTGSVTFWKTGAAIADAMSTFASDSITTGTDGLYQHLDMSDGTYSLTSTKVSGTVESNAIKANDALAALKIAVGMNPNADGSAVSSYQYLAADVNHDGQVKAADALNILKMAVKLSSAPEKEWLFVPESVGGESMSRTHVVWPDNPIPVTLDIDQELHLIGIVKGDVNGSWAA